MCSAPSSQFNTNKAHRIWPQRKWPPWCWSLCKGLPCGLKHLTLGLSPPKTYPLWGKKPCISNEFSGFREVEVEPTHSFLRGSLTNRRKEKTNRHQRREHRWKLDTWVQWNEKQSCRDRKEPPGCQGLGEGNGEWLLSRKCVSFGEMEVP